MSSGRGCASEGWNEGYKRRLEKTVHFFSPNMGVQSHTTPRSYYISGDRFIPNRNVMRMHVSQYLLSSGQRSEEVNNLKSSQPQTQSSPASPPFYSSNHGTYGWIEKRVDRRAYKNLLNKVFTGPNMASLSNARVLRFDSNTKRAAEEECGNNFSILDKNRYIPSFPEKVLDMPRISNSTNATLLDWNRTKHDMVVALAESVFTWNPIDRQCFRIPPQDHLEDLSLVTAVAFSQSSQLISIANIDGKIRIWNREQFCYNKKWNCNHKSPVTCFAWQSVSASVDVLYSGCECGCLLKNTISKYPRTGGDSNLTLKMPTKFAISRIKLNRCQQILAVASSNSSLVQVVDMTTFVVVKTIEAAHYSIMGLIWCSSNTFATGSGGEERSIKIWNVNSSSLIGIGVTKSRIFCLEWGDKYREIFSAHGHPHNCVYVWSYPLMEIKFRMCGHHAKVLHLCIGYEGKYLASLGVDETLLMWRIFDQFPDKEKAQSKKTLLHSKSISTSLHPLIR